MEDKVVIGIIGPIGSGKSTASEYICSRYNAKRHVFSDILGDILDRLYLPRKRENLQELGIALRKAFGENILANVMEEDIKKSGSRVILLDGIRYESEAMMVKKFKKGNILFIDADEKTRFERAMKRGEKDEKQSYEEFLKVQKKATEAHIQEMKKLADFVLENSSTQEELYKRIDEIMKSLLKS